MSLLFMLAVVGIATVGSSEASYTLGPRGLTSLTWDGWEFIGDPSYQGDLNLWSTVATFRRNDGTTYEQTFRTNDYRVPTARDTVGLDFPWGTLRATWSRPQPDRVMCRITLTNTGEDALVNIGGHLLVLDYPETPLVQDGNGNGNLIDYPRKLRPLTHPPILVLGLGEHGSQTLTIEGDLTKEWTFGGVMKFNSELRWSISWKCLEEVPKGTSVSMDFGMRFSKTAVGFADAAPDLLMRYAGTYPPLGGRLDRRPISREFLSNPPQYDLYPGTGHPPGNPRGYFGNSTEFDVRTDEGKAELRRRLLARADRTIANMLEVQAQGVIVWDIEGQQMYHPVSYVCSPDRTYEVSPEMAYVPQGETLDTASAFFRRFTDAGFTVGVCLRPQAYSGNAPDGPYTQVEAEDVEDPAELIRHKVDFAATHWGASLFYVDSNVSNVYGWPIPDRWLFGAALTQYPGIRLMGEWQNGGSYGTGAPYDATWFDKVYETRDRHRTVWPDANTSIAIETVDLTPLSSSALDAYTVAMRHGDVLLFDGAWPSPSMQAMRTLTARMGRRPGIALTQPEPGSRLQHGVPVRLRAAPSEGDATLTRVVFRSGGVSIGVATTAPWVVDWVPQVDGPHSLTATVEDQTGYRIVSAHHLVEVGDFGIPADGGMDRDAGAGGDGADGSVIQDAGDGGHFQPRDASGIPVDGSVGVDAGDGSHIQPGGDAGTAADGGTRMDATLSGDGSLGIDAGDGSYTPPGGDAGTAADGSTQTDAALSGDGGGVHDAGDGNGDEPGGGNGAGSDGCSCHAGMSAGNSYLPSAGVMLGAVWLVARLRRRSGGRTETLCQPGQTASGITPNTFRRASTRDQTRLVPCPGKAHSKNPTGCRTPSMWLHPASTHPRVQQVLRRASLDPVFTGHRIRRNVVHHDPLHGVHRHSHQAGQGRAIHCGSAHRPDAVAHPQPYTHRCAKQSRNHRRRQRQDHAWR